MPGGATMLTSDFAPALTWRLPGMFWVTTPRSPPPCLPQAYLILMPLFAKWLNALTLRPSGSDQQFATA